MLSTSQLPATLLPPWLKHPRPLHRSAKRVVRPPFKSPLRMTLLWARRDLSASATIYDTQALSPPVDFTLQGGTPPSRTLLHPLACPLLSSEETTELQRMTDKSKMPPLSLHLAMKTLRKRPLLAEVPNDPGPDRRSSPPTLRRLAHPPSSKPQSHVAGPRRASVCSDQAPEPKPYAAKQGNASDAGCVDPSKP